MYLDNVSPRLVFQEYLSNALDVGVGDGLIDLTELDIFHITSKAEYDIDLVNSLVVFLSEYFKENDDVYGL